MTDWLWKQASVYWFQFHYRKSYQVHISDGKIEHIEEDNDQLIEPNSHKNCRVIGGDHLTIIRVYRLPCSPGIGWG